jgi:hypothetical protein
MDQKAKNILFKTFWSSQGWTENGLQKIDPADFEYAKSAGVMFDPLTTSKAALFSQLNELINVIPPKKITDAFLNSLTNKKLEWRSALASYANAKRVLADPDSSQDHIRWGDPVDLNVLNFERLKWGGVRHFSGLYNWLDLSLFNKEEIPGPDGQMTGLLQAILDTIARSQPGDTPGKLRDDLKNAFNVSKNERDTLMETLGAAGIIRPLRTDRKEPGKHDWHFVLHWRGEDGYDHEVVAEYFGQYGIR